MLKLRRPMSFDESVALRLYDHAVARSRQPDLYLNCHVPDTVEGRFEVLTLHIVLTIQGLSAADASAARLRQALFDLYIRNLDGALREMGVGDLAVGKRMKALGGMFYGRARGLEQPLRDGDLDAIESLLARTVFFDRQCVGAKPLANYVLAEHRRLKESTSSIVESEGEG